MLPWDELPENMKNEAVKAYYDILSNKRIDLLIKRIFDLTFSFILLLILFLPMIIIGIAIKIDSPGSVFFRQIRVTRYGKRFKIFKFRSMVVDAASLGGEVTCKDDKRVTKVGKFIRKFRLDEIPQLINILMGDMSFVGTRPETEKYVDLYTDEMIATLLLPAGVTSITSIEFRNEAEILEMSDDVDSIYEKIILPDKMKLNLEYIKNFNFFYDIKVMLRTLFAVLKG